MSHTGCCTVSLGDSDISTTTRTCWGYLLIELRDKQHKDENLAMLLAWFEKKEEPAEKDLFIASIRAKSYWLDRKLFKLIDGVLYRQKPEVDMGDWLLVVPESLKKSVLSLHHDIPSAGHQGIARTKARLKEKFFWFQMSKDVESYVLYCNVCNQNKKNKTYGKVPLTEFQAGVPMERVHIDFIGPNDGGPVYEMGRMCPFADSAR